jgi:catechol 2,3-dioxygenase-like lactoylglutathione lyase family enzyme
MINALSHSFIWVLDHDEALDFYVGKLGFEIHTDAQLEFMRWLTVNVPGRPEHELVLMVPGPPALDPDTAEEVKQLLGKGAGAGFIVTTDDCRATYDERVGVASVHAVAGAQQAAVGDVRRLGGHRGAQR